MPASEFSAVRRWQKKSRNGRRSSRAIRPLPHWSENPPRFDRASPGTAFAERCSPPTSSYTSTEVLRIALVVRIELPAHSGIRERPDDHAQQDLLTPRTSRFATTVALPVGGGFRHAGLVGVAGGRDFGGVESARAQGASLQAEDQAGHRAVHVRRAVAPGYV